MKTLSTQKIIIAILFSSLFFISACNNSSSTSSGGGGGGGSGGDVPVASLAGTYTGTASATASALGLSESETVPVTIVIDATGKVTIQSGSDIFPDAITLTGNTFSHTQTFNNEDFGSAKCSGSLTLQGSIDSSGRLTATLSSKGANCTVNGSNIPGTITGSMTAQRQ